MYYEKIQGWFNYNILFDSMVNAYDNAVFVEIGTWKGRSAVYMGEKIKESGKKIKFFTVDTFDSTPDNDHFMYLDVNDLYDTALKNIEPVKEFVNVIKGRSDDVYSQFENESVDFLFIDGSHAYEAIKKDIELWYPKIKIGGVIGGHDYDQPTCGVKQAVDEYFGTNNAFNPLYNAWIYNKLK